MNFEYPVLVIKVVSVILNMSTFSGRKPFCEERAERLKHKARPVGKRPKADNPCQKIV